MRGNAVVDAAFQQHLHQANVIRIDVRFFGKCDLCGLLVGALAEPNADLRGQQLFDIFLAASQIRLDHRAHASLVLRTRMQRMYEVESALRVWRSFHVYANETFLRRGLSHQTRY